VKLGMQTATLGFCSSNTNSKSKSWELNKKHHMLHVESTPKSVNS